MSFGNLRHEGVPKVGTQATVEISSFWNIRQATGPQALFQVWFQAFLQLFFRWRFPQFGSQFGGQFGGHLCEIIDVAHQLIAVLTGLTAGNDVEPLEAESQCNLQGRWFMVHGDAFTLGIPVGRWIIRHSSDTYVCKDAIESSQIVFEVGEEGTHAIGLKDVHCSFGDAPGILRKLDEDNDAMQFPLDFGFERRDFLSFFFARCVIPIF